MRKALASLLVGAVLTGCAPAAPPAAVVDVAAVTTGIDALNKKFIAAMMAGDTAGALANYADDAVVMQPNDVAWKGRAEIAKGFAGMLAMGKLTQFQNGTDDVMVTGDVAIERGHGEMTITLPKGAPIHDKVKYLTVWKKQADGGWKIVRDISNTDLPPAK